MISEHKEGEKTYNFELSESRMRELIRSINGAYSLPPSHREELGIKRSLYEFGELLEDMLMERHDEIEESGES